MLCPHGTFPFLLSPFSPYSMMEMMGADIDKDFEKESSFIQGIKGFEDNISVRSLLTYKISVGVKGNYAVKKMPFTAVMNRSFILLPEQPMRLAMLIHVSVFSSIR